MVHSRDVQQLFLQSMLSRGAVPEQLAREIWKKCVKSVNALGNHHLPQSNDAWRQFVSSINASLDQLELAFRPIRDQRTGHNIYSIVNLKGDAVAQMATEYTAPEIAYFKAIVEQIILAPRHKYSVSSFVAMREVSMIKPKSNISKTQAEVVLATFVARGWLIKSKDGRYSLSSRSLMELAPYLQSNYAEHLIKCSLCEEILTTGIACFHEGCKCRVHPYCFKRYSEARTSGTLTCKICGNEWPREFNSDEFIPIGERAVRKGEHEQRARMGAASDGEDDDEDYQGEDVDMGSQSQSQSQSQPQTQTQGRKANRAKGKKTVVVEEEEEEAPASSSRPRRSTRR